MSTEMKPERAYFAAGEYITRFPAGFSHEILIESPREKSGWIPRSEKTHTHAVFPGTAILIDGRYYEVLSSARIPGEKPSYLYYLNPWPENFPIRLQFRYTKEECERLAASAKLDRQQSEIRTMLFLLSPLVGMLPAEDQLKLQNQYGINALRCTMISSFLLLGVGVLCLLLALIAIVSSPPAIQSLSPLRLMALALTLCTESIIRFISIRHDEPMGSILICAPLVIFRSIRVSLDPKADRKDAVKSTLLLPRKDEISILNDDELQVISVLPKPDWGISTGIQYNATWYHCARSEKLQNPTRYRFVLEKVPPGFIFRSTSVYDELDAQKRYREERRRDLGTWVTTFAPFWGLLNGEEQKKLRDIYGFNALKYTSWTIAVLLIVSSINIGVSIMNFTAGVGGPRDILWLLGAGYLFLENVLRLKTWLKNEPSGSILGALLRPFSHRFLEN